ncbi:MAG: Ribose import permease protein RbsC [Verrucomicrobia subdivision 3 bacterium]|nr:Ribose import permease protein RbsC [Limisphaerales bacterium]MCS1412329.1 Ribose import permease protein RbsC [Limisphaerales bacterium]
MASEAGKETLQGRSGLWRWINVLGPFLGLVIVTGLFALSEELRPIFFTGSNAKLILTQTVIVVIGALGMTMVIVSGGIDLSAGAVVALTSVVAATLLMESARQHWPFY